MVRSAVFFFLVTIILGCSTSTGTMSQTTLQNQVMRDRVILADMYADEYFPKHLVDECKAVMLEVCHRIEAEEPKDLNALYAITHAATERLNGLQEAFEENGSELETGAREALGEEFDVIAKAYGYDADVEEMIAPREW